MREFLIIIFTLVLGINSALAYELVLPKEKKSIANTNYAFFVGKAGKTESIIINDEKVYIAPNGAFAHTVKLKDGENRIMVKSNYNTQVYRFYKNKQENIIVVEEIKKIVVHISGQVVNPGVITLNENSRIVDAINEAGGLTNLADLNKINLAYVLEDAQKIYIPSVDDKEESKYILNGSGDTEIVTSSGSVQSKKEEKLMVNINTANAIELSKLPGIGNSTALKIINYRNENGKFNTIDDIKNVSGIGENKFNKIKDNIFVK